MFNTIPGHVYSPMIGSDLLFAVSSRRFGYVILAYHPAPMTA